MRIAIPTNSPGGLESTVSDHFGECDKFTIVDLNPEESIIEDIKVSIIENKDHLNCGSLILRLQKLKVDLIIINKIGKRPIQIIQEENIPIYASQGTVREVIHCFYQDHLQAIKNSNICPGTNSCQIQ